jgi:GNAT superfamily N-acetyltransferase
VLSDFHTQEDRASPATIVVLEGGAIRGLATTGAARGEPDRGLGELPALYVGPGAWRKGFGRRLMVEARARVSERGFVEAILWMLEGNERAERFYRVDGWRSDSGTATGGDLERDCGRGALSGALP